MFSGNIGGCFPRFQAPVGHAKSTKCSTVWTSTAACLMEWEVSEQRHGHPSAYDEGELANMGSRHDAGASWRSIRLYRCRSRRASPAHDSVPYVRLGVTLTATMRVPRVPRLSGDALPYRLHVGTVRNGKGELQDGEYADHVDMINRIMLT